MLITELHKVNEYNPPKCSPSISACMMLKNESKRIKITLKSIEKYVCSLIVFDTGSTDNTISILENWCKEIGIPLYLKLGEFKDFSSSRNLLLDHADEVYKSGHTYDYLLLLDCNDELRGGDKLIEECKKYDSVPAKVFMVRQEWLSGNTINKYLNSRLIKALHGWRYKKRVHEYLSPPNEKDNERLNLSEDITLYQNRNDDDDKTLKRFTRDKTFLLEDVKDGDPRDMFYLAQTLACLSEFDESYKWYQKRAVIVEGFWEERFHSYLRSGDICLLKKDTDNAIINFFKAAMIDCRVEPLLALSIIYRNKQDHFLTYMFSSIATKLSYPSNNILFISERDYTYERWQQHSVAAYYVGKYSEGLKSLEIAERTGNDLEAHQSNRMQYNDKIGKDINLFMAEDPIKEIDEIYNEFINLAKTSFTNNDVDMAILKLLQAFQLTNKISPLLMLAEYCRLIKSYNLSYWLVDFSLKMDIPPFIDSKEQKDYNYFRYHLLGIVGYYTEHFTEGQNACIKAIRHGQNISLDKKNYLTYLEKTKEEKPIEFNRQEQIKSRIKENLKNELLEEKHYN